jgi:hypothetical protein
MTFSKKRVLITIINVITVPAAAIFAFLLFMGGAFASDSGTTAAMVVSFSILGLALLYPILTIVAIIFSQKRCSIWLALLPFILPILLLAWLFSPWFSFS